MIIHQKKIQSGKMCRNCAREYFDANLRYRCHYRENHRTKVLDEFCCPKFARETFIPALDPGLYMLNILWMSRGKKA
jgi:hypothetical protein